MTALLLDRCMAGEPGLEELATTLGEVIGPRGHLLSTQKLRKGVYRIIVATSRRRLGLVAKRLTPPVAHRNQLTLQRWLPAAGLDEVAPRLIGVAAARTGHVVWHVYEDLGDSNLEHSDASRPEVEAAIRLIANVHARFAGDPLLAECRIWGKDHGIAFYDQSVQGAISAVGAAVAATHPGSRDGEGTRALLDGLERLADERDQRVRTLADLGGPDTLLHGDLWLDNVAVVPGSSSDRGLRSAQAVRLIDWDSAGPGPFSYDLSTLILRFPPAQQPKILALYRAAATDLGIDVPSDEDLEPLFTTAEYARLACMAIWPALVVAREGGQWALDELTAIGRWLEGSTYDPRSVQRRGER